VEIFNGENFSHGKKHMGKCGSCSGCHSMAAAAADSRSGSVATAFHATDRQTNRQTDGHHRCIKPSLCSRGLINRLVDAGNFLRRQTLSVG